MFCASRGGGGTGIYSNGGKDVEFGDGEFGE